MSSAYEGYLESVNNFVLDPGRVLDLTEDKWGHPEAVSPWSLDPAVAPTLTILSPDTPPEVRKQVAGMLQEQLDMAFAMRERDCSVDVYDVPGCVEEPDTPANVTVILPPDYDKSKKNRVMFYIPGGALVCWSLYAGPLEKWAKQFGCAVVAPRYRMAFDAPYPAAVNDVHAGYQWVLDNADEFGFDTSRIVITGISSGSHLALCMGFRLKRYGIKPRGIVAIGPQTGYSLTDKMYFGGGGYDSFAQNDSMALWLGRNADSNAIGPEALPNRATVEDCIGYPPSSMITGELDSDNVGSLMLYANLKQARSFSEYHSFGGMMHGCSGWNATIGGMPDESDLAKMLLEVAEKNIHDFFEYDLSRPWVTE